MITNEVQYRATKAHLDRFDEAAANIEARPGKRTKLEILELAAIRAQADDLRVELADYDELRSGALSSFEAGSLEELSTVLVKARIARGWTLITRRSQVHILPPPLDERPGHMTWAFDVVGGASPSTSTGS